MAKKPSGLQYHPLIFRILSHGLALQNSIKALKQKPIAFIITIITLAVIITLPSTLYGLLQNVQQLTGQLYHKPTISVYLQPQVKTADIDALIKKIQHYPSVGSARYISPQEGLKDFEKYSQFADVISLLPDNPLPGVINVTLASLDIDKKPVNHWITSLKKSKLVDQVSVDITWIQRLQYSLSMAQRATLTLTILLAAAMILVTSNTVHLTAQTHHQETEILQLIGATHDYIRRPFLYHGLIYGCCAGIAAWLLTHLILLWLIPPLAKLMQSYQTTQAISLMTPHHGLLIVATAITLSITGSWLATRHVTGEKR